LAELLSLTAGKVPLVIELKPQWNGDFRLAARSVELLKDYAGEHALMSFDPGVVTEVRRLSPATIRGFISDRGFDPYYNRLPVSLRQSLRTLSCLEKAAPHFLSMDIEELPWAPIETLRRIGMPVITWTIRSPEQAVLAMRYSDQITFEGFSA
jgi:glycerophosphoryl diester phosphodiesterase